MTTIKTTNKISNVTDQKVIFCTRSEGISVIAWFSDSNKEYAIRAYAPRNLSIGDAQWLAVALVRAQDAVKKACLCQT